MPALVSSNVGSTGINDEDGLITWSFSSKKEVNAVRIWLLSNWMGLAGEQRGYRASTGYRPLLGRTARAARSSRSAPLAKAAFLSSRGVGRRRRARTVTQPPATKPVTNHQMRSSIGSSYLPLPTLPSQDLVDFGHRGTDPPLVTGLTRLIDHFGWDPIGEVLLGDDAPLIVM
jgi:hypothetical protein